MSLFTNNNNKLKIARVQLLYERIINLFKRNNVLLFSFFLFWLKLNYEIAPLLMCLVFYVSAEGAFCYTWLVSFCFSYRLPRSNDANGP